MAKIKCPSCGSPNVEQIDTNKYQCPYCGSEFSPQKESTTNSQESIVSEEINDGDNSFGIYNVIGWLFYLVGIADFCGMFFDYDFTGVSWSPIVFAVIGSFFDWLGKRNN